MLKVKWIVGTYAFLFIVTCGMLLAGELFGPSFRSSYSDGLMQLLQTIAAAFIGFLTAFAAERE